MNSEIYIKFKKLYMSPKNFQYIMNLCNASNEAEKVLSDLQVLVYENFFEQVCQDIRKKIGKVDYEKVLITLNQITVHHFKQALQETQDTSSQFISNIIQHTIQPHQQTHLHQPIQPQQEQQIQPQINNQDNKLMETVETRYQHFFSQDAILQKGTYTFNLAVNRVKGFALSEFRINCDMYNVTEINNKLTLKENGMKIPMTVPIGFYNPHDLIETLSELFNKSSINGYTYTISIDKAKNKVYIQCDNIFDFTFSNMQFAEMLGFKQLDYKGNNVYISEGYPKENNQLYLKLLINGQEIGRIFCSNGFSYYERFTIDLNDNFGKSVSYILNEDFFDFFEEIDISSFSVELWSDRNNIYTRVVDFQLVVQFEYMSNDV